jgi:hypothetical protein
MRPFTSAGAQTAPRTLDTPYAESQRAEPQRVKSPSHIFGHTASRDACTFSRLIRLDPLAIRALLVSLLNFLVGYRKQRAHHSIEFLGFRFSIVHKVYRLKVDSIS